MDHTIGNARVAGRIDRQRLESATNALFHCLSVFNDSQRFTGSDRPGSYQIEENLFSANAIMLQVHMRPCVCA